MRRTLLLLSSTLALGLVFFTSLACEKVEVTELDGANLEPPDVAPDVTAPDVPPPPDVPASDGDDAGGGEPVVGAWCETDDQCPTAWCATTDSLAAALRRDYEVPGGLCTVLFCADDRACGAEAVCRDGGGFRLCAQVCQQYFDCRYAQGWVCDGPGGDAPAACLPAGGLAAAVCGDGVCDESERYVAGQCPADCPAPPQPPHVTGGPCAAPADCGTGFCLDKAFLAIALPTANVDVPNGYCSKNPLVSPCAADADCLEGGICADASALAGMPLKLCLHGCVDDGDCRYAEGYRCFATSDAADAQRGCLPASVIAAIRCNDGTCDPSEQFQPDLCSAADFQEDCQ
jgi:hypothetical protein